MAVPVLAALLLGLWPAICFLLLDGLAVLLSLEKTSAMNIAALSDYGLPTATGWHSTTCSPACPTAAC